MDRLTYRLIAASTTPKAGDGTYGLLSRLIGSGEPARQGRAGGVRVISVDAPCSAATRLLVEEFGDQAFTFPARAASAGPRALAMAAAPPFLADRDRDAEATAVDGVVQLTPLRFRLRTLDGLFADMPGRCALLHVSDGRHTAAVLAGARTVLASQRPLVVIGLSGNSDDERLAQITAAAARLDEHGYALRDSMLLPAECDATRREAVLIGAQTAFLAIPRERTPDALVRALLDPRRALPEALSGEDLLVAGLLRTMGSASLPIDRSEWVSFDESLVCDGFFPAERDGELAWRWSGPFPEARAFLPLRHAGTFQLELGIMNTVDRRLLDMLRLFVDGELLASETAWMDYGGVARGRFTVPQDRFKGWIELRLAYGQTLRPSPDDPRRLGLCISHCRIQGVDA